VLKSEIINQKVGEKLKAQKEHGRIKMKKYLHIMGWIDHRGRVDYTEIGIEIIVTVFISIFIIYLAI